MGVIEQSHRKQRDMMRRARQGGLRPNRRHVQRELQHGCLSSTLAVKSNPPSRISIPPNFFGFDGAGALLRIPVTEAISMMTGTLALDGLDAGPNPAKGTGPRSTYPLACGPSRDAAFLAHCRHGLRGGGTTSHSASPSRRLRASRRPFTKRCGRPCAVGRHAED